MEGIPKVPRGPDALGMSPQQEPFTLADEREGDPKFPERI